jgi:uncharacterized protein (TIGR00251 family)
LSNILQLRETKHGLTFDIQVTPHASHTQLVGVQEGILKIKVTALPVEGAANEACIKLLAKIFDLRKRQLEIFAGAKSRKKTVLVKDISRAELEIKIRRSICSIT